MAKRLLNMGRFGKRLWTLVRHRFFWILTISGNVTILIGAYVIHTFESPMPDGPREFIDSLLLSTGLVTTVGYGNFVAVTLPGKIAVLFLMLTGTLFVWTYMAFLVTGLIAPELSSLERDVHDMEKDLLDIKRGPTP